jgi:hypothetical protein
MFLVVCFFLNRTVHCTYRAFCTFTIVTTLQLEAYTNVLYYKHNGKTRHHMLALCSPILPLQPPTLPLAVIAPVSIIQ